MPNTVEWDGLLGSMTDEELARYREIATDQMGHERRLYGLQVACGVAACASLGWGLYSLATAGYSRAALLALGLSALLSYWPYRKIRTRRLWSHHCRAIGAELERRAKGSQ